MLNGLAQYRQRQFTLTADVQAQSLCERALRIREKVLGPEHPDTALRLGQAFEMRRDLAGAQSLYERALRIREKVLGLD